MNILGLMCAVGLTAMTGLQPRTRNVSVSSINSVSTSAVSDDNTNFRFMMTFPLQDLMFNDSTSGMPANTTTAFNTFFYHKKDGGSVLYVRYGTSYDTYDALNTVIYGDVASNYDAYNYGAYLRGYLYKGSTSDYYLKTELFYVPIFFNTLVDTVTYPYDNNYSRYVGYQLSLINQWGFYDSSYGVQSNLHEFMLSNVIDTDINEYSNQFITVNSAFSCSSSYYELANSITTFEDLVFKYNISRYGYHYKFTENISITTRTWQVGFYSCPLVLDSTSVYNSGYQNGYDTGHQEGYQEGHQEGLSEGAETGYQSGYEAGTINGINHANDYTFASLFGAVADTPVLMVRNLFNFDFFGVNVLTVVLSLFTALILFYIIRKLF